MWTCSTNLRFRALRFSKIIQHFINTGVTSSFMPSGPRETVVFPSFHFRLKSVTHFRVQYEQTKNNNLQIQYRQTDCRSFLSDVQITCNHHNVQSGSFSNRRSRRSRSPSPLGSSRSRSVEVNLITIVIVVFDMIPAVWLLSGFDTIISEW